MYWNLFRSLFDQRSDLYEFWAIAWNNARASKILLVKPARIPLLGAVGNCREGLFDFGGLKVDRTNVSRLQVQMRRKLTKVRR